MVENHWITPMTVSIERLEEALDRLNDEDREHKRLMRELKDAQIRAGKL